MTLTPAERAAIDGMTTHCPRLAYARGVWTVTCRCGWTTARTTAIRARRIARQHTEKETHHA